MITFHLPVVTRLTEMCVAPAEPLRNRAAEFTFEFYEVSSMHGAVLNACAYAGCGALTAQKILRFVLLPFLSSLLLSLLLSLFVVTANFEASKIGLLAFETLII